MYGGAKDLMASLGRDGAAIPRGGHACGGHAASEKGAVSAQKLGQLQPFDSRRECLGQLASLFWADLTPLSLQGKPPAGLQRAGAGAAALQRRQLLGRVHHDDRGAAVPHGRGLRPRQCAGSRGRSSYSDAPLSIHPWFSVRNALKSGGRVNAAAPVRRGSGRTCRSRHRSSARSPSPPPRARLSLTCPSPLSVREDTYDHSCYCAR
jgi:hypothetical protein